MVDEIGIDDAVSNQLEDELFDLENIPIVFASDLQENVAEEGDSEDELPLEVIRREELRKKSVIWRKGVSYVTRVNSFATQIGPNIPDNIETPTDLFSHLF